MRKLAVGIMALATLAACDTSRSLSDSDRASLQQHEDQWDARSFHSYVFDYSESQFGSSYNARITVQNDSVVHVIDPQTGEPPATPRTWPTMDGIFNEADFAVDENDITVSLEYDDQYGYITLLNVQSNNPGGGFLARVSNLQPSP